VIAEHDEQRVVFQPPLAQTSKQLPERRVSFMQRIEVGGKVPAAFERSGAL
jgi:hypothetical protein